MNALKVKKNGWLWKLALEGGLPSDGMVPDKANAKFNRLQRARYDASEIGYDELSDVRRDPERPVDFCDFTRFSLLGGLKWLFISVCVAVMFIVFVVPTMNFFWWVISGLFGFHWGVQSKMQQFGSVTAGVEAGVASMILIVYYWDHIKRVFIKTFTSSNPNPELSRLQKAQKAYDKAEFRKAFVQSVKGTTCFKMEIVENE